METHMNKDEIINHSEEVGLLLKKLSKSLGSISNQLMAKHDVTESLASVLSFLESRNGMETCQVDIQNALHLTNPAVTKLVGRLEEKGLIRINKRDNDQRYKIIELTELGKQTMNECKVMKEPLQLQMLHGFNTSEIEHIKELLNRIQKNIDDLT